MAANLPLSEAVHSDQALARRILKGDAAAFREVFDRVFPRLYRFALARLGGDSAAAEDVVQQTFCKALECLDSYRGQAALYTWFSRICRNTLLDYCRSNGRRMRTICAVEDQPALQALLETFAVSALEQPEADAWRGDVARLVQATLDILPDRYCEILEWKYLDDVPVKEIATRLELGPKAAESLLTRARNAFREAIAAMVEPPEVLHPPQN